MSAQVVLIMGSESDEKIIRESKALEIFTDCGVTFEMSIISAHRHPDILATYCQEQDTGGTLVFIGVAGLLNVLASTIAGITKGCKLVLTVALSSSTVRGYDMLAPLACLPKGILAPVAGHDSDGLHKAVQMACTVVALCDPSVKEKYAQYLASSAKPYRLNIPR